MTTDGAIELHDIPDRLIPQEPRLGGSCVPVPAGRLTALSSSGPVLLGRHDGQPTIEFTASVIDELRQVMRVPQRYRCVVLPVPTDAVYRAVALEDWAADLTVIGQGQAAARWRAAVAARREWPAVAAQPTDLAMAAQPTGSTPVAARPAGPTPEAVGVVVREDLDAAGVTRTAQRWVAADLSRTSGPITDPALDRLDVGFLCPSWLFGVPPGSTVVVLSDRAVAAARTRHDTLGGAGLFLPTLHTLTTAGGTAGMADLIMLAHAVRARLEAAPDSLETAAQARQAIVAAWAATRPWATCAPRPRGGDLTALVRTSLDVGVLRRVGAFLSEHHLGYGVVDDREPDCLRLGLGDGVPIVELERLLGLVDLLVARLTRVSSTTHVGSPR